MKRVLILFLLLYGTVAFGYRSELCNSFINIDTLIRIDLNGDTIAEIYDKQNRLLEKYVNGFIAEKRIWPSPDTIVLADLVVKVSQLTKPEYKYPLQKGDTVVIQVCEKKRRKLKQVDFIQGDKGNRFSAVKIDSVLWRDIIEEEGEYKLKVHNFLSLFKRVCCIKAIRIPEVIPEVTKYVRDTLTLLDSISKVVSRDTFLVPILDKTIYLPPVRDIERLPYHIEQFDLPVKADSLGSLKTWAYWIGVGNASKKQYNDLESSVPATWSKPGVSIPLGAFILKKDIILPSKKNKEVKYVIGNEGQINYLISNLSEKLFDSELSNSYWKIKSKRSALSSNYLLIANMDEVNGYSIPIKIIAMKVKENFEKVGRKTFKIGKPRPESEIISN